jgi:ABC-type sugar transport system substrate-binding protein
MKNVKIARKLLATVLVILVTFSFAGFSSAKTAKVAAKTLRFAYMSPSLSNPFWKTVSNGVAYGAKQQGITLKIYDSNNSASTQLKNAQDIITQQYDGIILTPTDSSAAPSVLAAAKAASIPVVLVNVGSFSGKYVTLIDSAEKAGGLAVGRYLASKLKTAKLSKSTIINEITISLARTNGQNRHGGFLQGLKANGYKIKYVKQSALYTRAEAYKFTQDMITAYPKMKALFCNFDEAALGAMKAIQDLGKSKKITLIGYDGSQESVKYLKAGKIDAICLQEPFKQGRVAPMYLKNYINGKTVKKEIQIPTTLITKTNVSKYAAILKNDVFGK